MNDCPSFIKLFPEEDNYGNEINIKLRAGAAEATIPPIADIDEAYNPRYPFDFNSVDEEYQAVYESETRTSILAMNNGRRSLDARPHQVVWATSTENRIGT